MKPEILVRAASPSPSVMQQLEQHFTCHHAWSVPAAEQAAFIAAIAANVRGVVTPGQMGISGQLAAALPKLEIIAVNGVGVDAIPFDITRARGIKVSNTPGVLTDDVADMAVTLLLAMVRRIPAMDLYVRRGDWEKRLPIAPASALRGKVAGIFGFGRIGQAIASRLAAFGVLARYYQPRAIAGTDVPRAASLLALAEESDYLIIAAPGVPETRNSVDAEVLAALGPGGTLVNIARGSLVDENALIAALREGSLGAAALDVFADEPNVPPALRALDNVILMPHIGSLTVETRHAMGQLVVDNLKAYFAGQALLTPVN
ncbi:MAG TPA: 2-hydroxyacid dehydrogenase [Janthinobacterium sp.]|jgi:lactate dehydrogenase-like 2-hydroxyacid dehydrogenase|nr:2-hydroxyacid dehydrogenase [Janthinobacterium sp.]